MRVIWTHMHGRPEKFYLLLFLQCVCNMQPWMRLGFACHNMKKVVIQFIYLSGSSYSLSTAVFVTRTSCLQHGLSLYSSVCTYWYLPEESTFRGEPKTQISSQSSLLISTLLPKTIGEQEVPLILPHVHDKCLHVHNIFSRVHSSSPVHWIVTAVK